MARKHRKQGIKKSAVEQHVLAPETSVRKVLTNPETGLIEAVRIVTPAVIQQGRALAPTTSRGQRNDVANMAPKGGKAVKPAGRA